jgi:phage replication initiation protein
VDWVNATFPPPPISVADIVDAIRASFGGLPLALRQLPGVLGFGERHQFLAIASASRVALGSVSIGGEAQARRWMLQFTGTGCERVIEWLPVRDLLGALDAKLTRLDLKVDFPNGELSLDDVQAMVDQGGFTVFGRKPAVTVAGDWLAGERGRTLYVGKPENGKVLRAYEKGKQLGDLRSRWLRVEVQFGNRGRDIPLDAITDPDPYFAGAYPALRGLLPVAARAMQARRKATLVSLGRKLFHLRLSYGGAIAEALAATGADEQKLVDALRIPALTKGADESSARAIHWDEISAEIERHLSSRKPARQHGGNA